MSNFVLASELGLDFPKTLPHLNEWGWRSCDFSGRIFHHSIEELDTAQLKQVRKMSGAPGVTTGSSYYGRRHVGISKLAKNCQVKATNWMAPTHFDSRIRWP
jgi:hypothetical protein